MPTTQPTTQPAAPLTVQPTVVPPVGSSGSRVRACGARLPRRRGDRGAAAVEFLLTAPLLMLMCLLLIQWAVRAEAARVINAAAREGAVATASWDGTESAGRETALDYLADLDPQVTHRAATATRGPTAATVTVSGNVLSLIPGVDLHVSATATVPTERFVP